MLVAGKLYFGPELSRMRRRTDVFEASSEAFWTSYSDAVASDSRTRIGHSKQRDF